MAVDDGHLLYNRKRKQALTGRMDGKVAVITGAASGLGEATARRFSEEGARLILADIQRDKIEALAAELGHAVALQTDVSKEAEVAATVALAVERFGRLDAMVNNAGIIGARAGIRDIEADDWQATMAVLLNSVFYGSKHAARVMVEQGFGCILNNASVGGVAPMGPCAYSTAKHGVIGMTKSVATELAPHGISVNAVAPGTVATNLNGLDEGAAQDKAYRNSALNRAVQSVDIANGFLFLASDEGRNITGQVMIIDGGLTALPVAMWRKHESL